MALGPRPSARVAATACRRAPGAALSLGGLGMAWMFAGQGRWTPRAWLGVARRWLQVAPLNWTVVAQPGAWRADRSVGLAGAVISSAITLPLARAADGVAARSGLAGLPGLTQLVPCVPGCAPAVPAWWRCWPVGDRVRHPGGGSAKRRAPRCPAVLVMGALLGNELLAGTPHGAPQGAGSDIALLGPARRQIVRSDHRPTALVGKAQQPHKR